MTPGDHGSFSHKLHLASWLTHTNSPDSLRIEWATKSACLSVLRTPVVRKVGVMSIRGSFTWAPNTYTTLERGGGERKGERIEER